jgi:hypothetical protein
VYETLFSPGNIIASVGATNYICEGCLNGPELRGFFGVTAENQAGLSVPSGLPQDFAGLTKADAVPVEINPAFAEPFPVNLGVSDATGKPDAAESGVLLPPSILNPSQTLSPPIEYRPPVGK